MRLSDMPLQIRTFKDSSGSKDMGIISATISGRSKNSDLMSNPTGFYFNYKNHINFSNLLDSESKILRVSNKEALEAPPNE